MLAPPPGAAPGRTDRGGGTCKRFRALAELRNGQARDASAEPQRPSSAARRRSPRPGMRGAKSRARSSASVRPRGSRPVRLCRLLEGVLLNLPRTLAQSCSSSSSSLAGSPPRWQLPPRIRRRQPRRGLRRQQIQLGDQHAERLARQFVRVGRELRAQHFVFPLRGPPSRPAPGGERAGALDVAQKRKPRPLP